MTPLRHAIAVRISTRFKLIDCMKGKSIAPDEMLKTVKHCLISAAADENFMHYGITQPYEAADSSTVFFIDVGDDVGLTTVYCKLSKEGNVVLRTLSNRDLPETWKPAAHA